MGYRCTWIGVRGKPLSEILQPLLLELDGNRYEFSEPGFNALEAKDGWNIVIADGGKLMMDIVEENALALSAGFDCLFFRCEDTSMYTKLALYRDAIEVWSIEYCGADGISAPVVTDEVPELVRQTIAERTLDQAADDDEEPADHLYDITATVGLRIAGFRHDEEPELPREEPILGLRRAANEVEKKGWFSRWKRKTKTR